MPIITTSVLYIYPLMQIIETWNGIKSSNSDANSCSCCMTSGKHTCSTEECVWPFAPLPGTRHDLSESTQHIHYLLDDRTSGINTTTPSRGAGCQVENISGSLEAGLACRWLTNTSLWRAARWTRHLPSRPTPEDVFLKYIGVLRWKVCTLAEMAWRWNKWRAQACKSGIRGRYYPTNKICVATSWKAVQTSDGDWKSSIY